VNRAAILAEAHSWLRTPYRNCANVKGAGVDCAMLLVEVYRQPRGPVPPDFDPRPYSPEWYLHRTEELYLFGIERYAKRVTQPQPGDVAVYRFGYAASHGAIIVDDNYIIHAHKLPGNVELCERRALEERLDSYWSVL
jgi:NlpC/P60 family putative phage cell wall peptidase